MSKTIELTDEQWDAYKRGEPVTVQKPKLWKPEGGKYLISEYGCAHIAKSDPHSKLFGTEYPTRDLAERARDLMRPIHRYIAYAMEHWPDYEVPSIGEMTYCVTYDGDFARWILDGSRYIRRPGVPYGPEDKVRELADRLNRGEVKF